MEATRILDPENVEAEIAKAESECKAEAQLPASLYPRTERAPVIIARAEDALAGIAPLDRVGVVLTVIGDGGTPNGWPLGDTPLIVFERTPDGWGLVEIYRVAAASLLKMQRHELTFKGAIPWWFRYNASFDVVVSCSGDR